MKNNQSKGSFSKVRKLINVLKKSNGKGVIGDNSALISPTAAKILVYFLLLALTGALFAGVYFLQPYLAGVLSLEGITLTLMLILLVMSFVLALKDIVTVLYASDDLELLLPMPFSAGQIVMAKVAVVSEFPIGASFVLMNSICLALGIREGAGAVFIIGTVLSSILIPVTGIATALLLVVIIFRIFGFIRNRDILVAIGGFFTFGLTIAYLFINSKVQSGGTGKAAAAAVGAVSYIANGFPNIYFMSRFMLEGSIVGLLISVAVCALITALAMSAVRAFYFTTALSMQATGTNKKAFTKASLSGGKKNDALKALTVYESRSTRRNPAYWLYGFIMTLAWPLLFGITLVLGNLDALRLVTFPLDRTTALYCFMTLGIIASCFACGFNVLPGSAFSREGSCFGAIRSLPVDFRDYYRSKRNFSLRVCSLGSVLYIVILGILFLVAGFVEIKDAWTILAGVCAAFLLDLTLINLMLLRNSRKPRLNWDSETAFARKLGLVNIIAILIGTLLLAVFLGAISFMPTLQGTAFGHTILIICAAVGLALVLLAAAVNYFAVRKASQNLMRTEV